VIALLVELAKAACLGAVAFYCSLGWATWCERFADSACTCRKGAWDPDCPVHGRRAEW
jgi:hypothetical protein